MSAAYSPSLFTEQPIDKCAGIENRHIVHVLTSTNEQDGQVELVRDGEHHTALGGAV